MKIVHGFRCGLPVFGVRTPVLPVSVTGDFGPAESETNVAVEADVEGSGNAAVEVLLGVTASLSLSFSPFSRSIRSLSLRSFFSFFLALSRSAFSEAAAPFILRSGLSLPDTDGGDVGALVLVLLERWGGRARSFEGTGVVPFVGGWLALLGRAEVVELGVPIAAAVRL